MPAKPDTEQQNAAATPNPTLGVRALIEEDAFCPNMLPSTGQDDSEANGHLDPSYAFNLSKLLFMPPAPEQGTKDATVHTIVGVFATVPPPAGMMMDVGLQWAQAGSVVGTWEVQTGLADRLSSCFDQLSVKKKGTSGVAPRVSNWSLWLFKL